MEINQDKNKLINNNNNSFENECTFNKIKKLQILIKNEFNLKEECK